MKYFIFVLLYFVVLANCYTQDLNDNSKNEPKFAISRSTLGLSGSSKVISTLNGTYYVSQSIGQTSVIGTKINRNYTILQGYQLSTITVNMNPNVENDLEATIHPNPFEESINISFDKLIKEEISIQIFDMTGREVFSKRFPPNQILNVRLHNISIGIYSMLVISENEQFVANILKK